MALSPYALISEDQFKAAVPIQGSSKDGLVQDIINRATSRIESYLGRELVTRGDVTEYHSFDWGYKNELYLSQYPVITVTSVKTDEGVVPRTYTTTLVADTDYALIKSSAKFVLLSGYWPSGWRGVQVIAKRGYLDRAAVPQDIVGIAIRLAATMWAESSNSRYGVSSVADASGSFTRYAPSDLTNDMKEALSPYKSVLQFTSAEVA